MFSPAAYRLVCIALIGSIIAILIAAGQQDHSCAWLKSPVTGRWVPPSYECGSVR